MNKATTTGHYSRFCKRGHLKSFKNTRGWNCRPCDNERKRIAVRKKRGLPADAIIRPPRKAFCVRGHARTPDNVRQDYRCRKCDSLRVSARRRKRTLPKRCDCAHFRKSHDIETGECYHKDAAGRFDCCCTKLRIAA